MALRLFHPARPYYAELFFDGAMDGPNDARRLARISGGATLAINHKSTDDESCMVVARRAEVCPYATGTNNEAEFWALVVGLKLAKQYGFRQLKVWGDSKLIVRYMLGLVPKKKHLRSWWRQARGLAAEFEQVTYHWHSRETEAQRECDLLAGQALGR